MFILIIFKKRIGGLILKYCQKIVYCCTRTKSKELNDEYKILNNYNYSSHVNFFLVFDFLYSRYDIFQSECNKTHQNV